MKVYDNVQDLFRKEVLEKIDGLKVKKQHGHIIETELNGVTKNFVVVSIQQIHNRENDAHWPGTQYIRIYSGEFSSELKNYCGEEFGLWTQFEDFCGGKYDKDGFAPGWPMDQSIWQKVEKVCSNKKRAYFIAVPNDCENDGIVNPYHKYCFSLEFGYDKLVKLLPKSGDGRINQFKDFCKECNRNDVLYRKICSQNGEKFYTAAIRIFDDVERNSVYTKAFADYIRI
ncbi:MAG: hypothetical protein ACI396_04550 [Acutalibacteraceae bacterium]